MRARNSCPARCRSGPRGRERRMPFATRFAAALVLLVACTSPAAAAGNRSGVTTNPDTTTIAYTFGCYEMAGYESNHPEWTGVDVYRREPAGCGAWQRINDTPYA